MMGCSSQSLPTGAGGTIRDGAYVLVASTYHGTCPAAEVDRFTWLVCGRSWQTVEEATTGGTTTTRHGNVTVTATGASLNAQFTCGATGGITYGYDASPTTLTLYVPGVAANSGRVDTFARE
jgi:hypothetical protein